MDCGGSEQSPRIRQSGEGDVMGILMAAIMAAGGIFDKFNKTTLNAVWTWSTPKAGPTYSLTARPSWFRISLSGVFDQWVSVAESPKLLRNNPSGDWTIETRLNMTTYTPGANFHIGLAIWFSQFNVLNFGPRSGSNRLAYEQSGVDHTQTPDMGAGYFENVYLRIRKVGTVYYFDYKINDGDSWSEWTSLNYSSAPPVKVGLMVKTWISSNNVVADFDYHYLRT